MYLLGKYHCNTATYYTCNMNDLATRVRTRRLELGISQAALGERAGLSQSTIAQIEGGRNTSTKFAMKLAWGLGCSVEWLLNGKGEHPEPAEPEELRKAGMLAVRNSAEVEDPDVQRIPYFAAKGACGNGVIHFENGPQGYLIKEASFFEKYGVPADEIVAIFAEGSSNAEYIVDGDICLFDRRKREPQSGKIFLIEHPDGLVIKVLRRRIDGAWVLESKNQDKNNYPDEVIPPQQAGLLHICGQFFYRQGG